ncbi:MAG: hypothetical protein ACK559_34960, partial [bacterium]
AAGADGAHAQDLAQRHGAVADRHGLQRGLGAGLLQLGGDRGHAAEELALPVDEAAGLLGDGGAEHLLHDVHVVDVGGPGQRGPALVGGHQLELRDGHVHGRAELDLLDEAGLDAVAHAAHADGDARLQRGDHRGFGVGVLLDGRGEAVVE